MPVFSLSTCIKGTVKVTSADHRFHHRRGEIIHPGDVIVGDADGLTWYGRDEVADVAKLRRPARMPKQAIYAAYKAGKSVVEVSNLEAVLKAKGLVVDI